MSNYNPSHKDLSEYFKNLSKIKEERSKKFFDNLYYVVDDINDAVKLEYDLKNKYHKDYLYYKGISDYINTLAINKKMTPVFITLTLRSEYHVFKKQPKSGKIIKNSKRIFNSSEISEAINKGYKLLNKAFHEIVRQGQRKSWNIENLYIKVIEPHKSFTPHLHAIVFVGNNNVEKFVKVVKNKIKLYRLGKQYKIEILEDETKGSAYILKYLQKTLMNEDKEFLYLYDGWKKAGKIRTFTHSIVGIDRNAFNKLVNHFVNKHIRKKYDYKLGKEIQKEYL